MTVILTNLYRNALHLTEDIPANSNICVALRDTDKQTFQPPRILFIYFKKILFDQATFLFMYLS